LVRPQAENRLLRGNRLPDATTVVSFAFVTREKELTMRRLPPPLTTIVPIVSVAFLLASARGADVALTGIERTELADYYPNEPLIVSPAVPPNPLPLSIEAAANAGLVVGTLQLKRPALMRLRANGFVVYRPAAGELQGIQDVAAVYDYMTHEGVPNFITSDTLLHIYHVQFDEILKNVEEREFLPDITTASRALMDASSAHYATLAGELQEAARRNTAFFCVAVKLLDPTAAVPGFVAEQVQAELALIESHGGFAASPIFAYDEDYSQYVPRGHYTRSDGLRRYFKAMMWFGRIGFLLKGCQPACSYCPCFITEDEARIQTLQASLVTIALDSLQSGGRSVGSIWDRIYAITAYFVGLADDLTPYDYVDAIRAVFGSAFEWTDLVDPQRLFDLNVQLASLPNPQIYGGTGGCQIIPPVSPAQLDECLDRSKGLRFMGQRFVPDSYMMQNLVCPAVGRFLGAGEPFTMCLTPAGPMRCFPRGLDVMALLGSAEARSILLQGGDTAYAGFSDAFRGLATFFTHLSEADWNRNLYWSWLYTLKSLLADPGPGYPAFMRSPAWRRKQLNAALASWAELRHDTILYAKQSTTPGVTSAPPPPDLGYVEPVPETFHHLSALTRMTRLGLGGLGVLDTTETNRLLALEQILDRLTSIAIAQLEARPISAADSLFIKDFGNHLEMTLASVSTGAGEPTIVADVHTDANTFRVLEEGVGYFDIIVVAYPVPDGRLLLGAGPVFSYYEFKWPMSNRLTDEAWKLMLDAGQGPEPPSWASTFHTQSAAVPVPADLDGDKDADLDDLVLFQACVSGPSIPLSAGCESRDFDADGDVDQSDFGLLQRCLLGPDIASDPACMELLPRPRIAESHRSECQMGSQLNQRDPWIGADEFAFTAQPGALAITHRHATYNCCLDDILVELSVGDGVLRLAEKEVVPDPCRCICDYDVSATVVSLPAGPCTFEYCWADDQAGAVCVTSVVFIP